jgi:hypothetical protein
MTKITSLRNTAAGIGLAAVMLFAGVMGASCDNPEGSKTAVAKCECPAGTEHLYDASNSKCCEGTDCACRIYYGEVKGLKFNSKDVKIYKKAGANLTPEQMAQAVENFQYGFDHNGGILPDLISEINIFTGSIGYDYYSYDNNMVLDLNFNEIGAAGDYLVSVSLGYIPKGDFE